MSFLIRSSLSVVLLSFFVLGASSCQKETLDGFKCVTIKHEDGHRYLRCRNSKSKQSFNSELDIIGHGIRNQDREIEWMMTDLEEYELLRKQISEKCKVK